MDEVGEIIGKHFLGIFGKFTMLEVPAAVHEKLRILKDNLLIGQSEERAARVGRGLPASALKEGKFYLTQMIPISRDSDSADKAAYARQDWCLEVGLPIGPPQIKFAAATTTAGPATVTATAAAAVTAVIPAAAAIAPGDAPAAAAPAADAANVVPVETQQIERVFGSIEELIAFLQACVSCRLRNLFFKWTMSEKVTPSVWRGFVDQVVCAAERIKAATLRNKTPPQVVAFIDELNTAPTPVLAAIKECFVDFSYRGRPLPANIFWFVEHCISIVLHASSLAVSRHRTHHDVVPSHVVL